ncbi:MAG: protein kinase [Oscillospiraceae bacterium]|nr:protein kinase [Oscillospiraceae bacterium]
MDKSFCPYCMSPVEEGAACPSCGLTAGAYTPSPHHLPLGTILMGRYLVGRVLGEGGFGITYIGCDLRLELKVAIKEYFPTDKVTRLARETLDVTSYMGAASAGYEEGKVRFLNEARTMARMDKQPEIVGVRDFFECNNTAYIVMEFVNGTTFKELVAQKGGRIPAKELLPVMEPLFSALSAMHQQGLIHRDISPDNLMLERGALRLLDFGCARESSRGTETMTITLKHGFAPLEQYQHKGQGPWTDVYALAATIYYCLTGKIPPQALDRLCEDELILPRKLGVDITERQEQALLYGMGIRPRRRFQSVEELHAAIYIPDGAPIPCVEEEPLMPASTVTVQQTEEKAISATASAVETIAQTEENEIGATVLTAVEVSVEEISVVEETPAEEIGVTAPAEADTSVEKLSVTAEAPAEEIGATVLTAEEAPAEQIPTTEAAPAEKISATAEAPAERINVTAEAPAEELSAAETGHKTGWKDLLQQKKGMVAAICAAAVLLLVLVFTLGGGNSDTPDVPEVEQSEDLFASAKTLSVGGEWELSQMMKDDDVSAIILETWVLLQNEELVITKPVRVAEGHGFNTLVPITVAEGGYLYCEGQMCLDALVRCDGGTIHIADRGRLDGGGYLWLNDRSDLILDSGAIRTMVNEEWDEQVSWNHLIAEEEMIFAEAAHVNSFEELVAANDDPGVSAIVIDSDIRLEIEDGYLISKPVRISEGVTVDMDRLQGHEFSGAHLCVGSTMLFNYGTLHGAMNMGNWFDGGSAVVNYGRIETSTHMDVPGCFINYGEFVTSDTHIPQGTLINVGTIEHNGSMSENVDSRYMDVADGFINHGEIRIYDENAHIMLAGERVAFNSGSIIAENDGVLMVENYLVNSGTIDAAYLDGSGVIEHTTTKAELVSRGGPFCGLITYNIGNKLELSEEHWCAKVPFDWNEDGPRYENIRHFAGNAEELKSVLEYEPCEIIKLQGDVEWNGDLVINKGLAIEQSLTVHGNVIVGEGGYVMGNNMTVDGDIIVENGGVWLNRGEVQCREVIVNDAWFFNHTHFREMEHIQINGGRFVNLGGIELQGKHVDVAGGELVNLGGLWLEDCEVTIAKDAWLVNAQGNFAFRGCRIENSGHLNLHFWAWQEHTFEEIEMVNHGEMGLSDQMELRGHVENHGTIRVWGFVPVNGTIANHGKIIVEDGNIYAVDGEITGNAIIKR